MTIKKGGRKASKAETRRNTDRGRNLWQLWAKHRHAQSICQSAVSTQTPQ